MVSLSALRGYVLEEAVARMLATCGYNLLTHHTDDPKALRKGANGLLVRGRGANHQADALGELMVPTPFSLPTRLFVEAKFRRAKTGLDTVRNALGVLNDVNEYYRPRNLYRSFPTKRYQYRYALFSSSGFSTPAQSFALAQQISLIDLSGSAFDDLREIVDRAASRFYDLALQHGLNDKLPVYQVRGALRKAFGTLDPSNLSATEDESEIAQSKRPPSPTETIEVGRGQPLLPEEAVREIAEQMADELNAEFFLAFPDAPFIIALRPNDVAIFNDFLKGTARYREVQIGFHFSDTTQNTGEWVISSETYPDVPLAFFGLPPILEAWLLGENDNQREARQRIKRESLSTLTIYRGEQTIQLRYTPLRRTTDQVTRYTEARTPLRRNYPSRVEVPKDRRTVNDLWGAPDIDDVYARFAESPKWSVDAIRTLLQRLTKQRPTQAQVLRETAARGGVIPRDRVYEIAGYDKRRSLRGFTRPIRRISDELVDDGLLQADAPYPFAAWYPEPGPAIWFTMPRHVAEAIRSQI